MTQHQEPQQPWPNQPPAYGTPAQQPAPPPRKRKAPIWLIVTTAVIVGLCGIGTVTAIATSSTELDEPAAAPASTDAANEPAADEPTSQPTEPAPEPEPEPEPEPDLSAAQEQAVGMADDYLAYTAFSRKGLIEQLEFEGFETADAEFAVDYLDVDWKEQAAKMAEDYLDYSNFSRQGLIEQLEYEGFSREQAEYGVNEAGL